MNSKITITWPVNFVFLIRYPKTKSLPEVLAEVPNTPEGRQFVHSVAQFITSKFGIWVPDFVVDKFFEDSSSLLNYLKLTAWELYDGAFALNLAYWNGLITSCVHSLNNPSATKH